ncbi:MAG: transcriptional repressor [Verrucomicrobiota bacterium]
MLVQRSDDMIQQLRGESQGKPILNYQRIAVNRNLRIDSHARSARIASVQLKTQQRSSILRVLDHLSRPVTPQELLDAASAESPGLGLATVYRALKRLVESGDVRKIEVAGVPPHYELERDQHHHFFVCEDCEKMFDLDGCPGGFKKLLPPGFTMSSHEVIIYGTCQTCGA